MDGVLKIDHHRVFPKYSSQTFESWFKKNAMASQDNYKKHVSFSTAVTSTIISLSWAKIW